MKRNIAIITLITFLTGTVLLANTLGLSDNGDGTWNVDYVSDGDIAGFQFNVDGVTLNGASGGDAGAAGFMISTSSSMALGFSLTGSTFGGEGVMVVLDLTGTPAGLSGIIVSDPAGTDMGFTYDAGGGGGDWDGDGCSMPDQSIHITSSGSVLYNSSADIGGFQFNVEGATINTNGASG